MESAGGGVILVIGGSGFIGQHIIKLLIEKKDELRIKEIRSVDVRPYENRVGHSKSNLRTFLGDICQPDTMTEAFHGVDTVFHCAALVSIAYPPNFDELERVNVEGTRNVVDLCIKNNVSRLIFTSCASVCIVPFKGHSSFALVINQTETKATTPMHDTQKSPKEFDKLFLIPGYSSSKLRAERIVLSSNGATLSNDKGYLATVAIRPPLTYGEGDNHFMPQVMGYLAQRGNRYPRIAGAGGKQQLAYAGNVAWGHICAFKTLRDSAKSIAALPVFITDDTPINDMSRFVQKIGTATDTIKYSTTFWYLPHFVFFLLAAFVQFCVKMLQPIIQLKLKHSPKAIASFTASVLMFNRLRASIHMDYEPIVTGQAALTASARWYAKWYAENISSSAFDSFKNANKILK